MGKMSENVLNWKNKGKTFTYNDFNIFYIKEGQGPFLLMLHGYPYSSYDYKFIWKNLTSKYTLVTLDFLGMGFSDKPKNHRYSYEEYCNIITTLFSKLKIEKCHIIAHDLGVSIGQELMTRELEQINTFKIESIAFLNGSLFIDVYEPRVLQKLLSKSPKLIGKILSRMISKKSVNNVVNEVFGPKTKPNPELLDELWEVLTYKKGKSITYLLGRLIFEKIKYQQRWIKTMQITRIPMCFINGPFDPNSGMKMTIRYKQLIPNPNVILLKENIGHWPQIEAPVETLEAYNKFKNEYFFYET